MKRAKGIKIIRSYSEALKLKVVSEIESGRCTMAEASRHYGMTKGSVLNWVRKYGNSAKRTRIVTVVPKEEQERIKELEAALAESHLKNRFYEKLIEVANEHYGEDIKKNFSTPPSENSKRVEKK